MINSGPFYSAIFSVAAAAFGIELLAIPVSAHFLYIALISFLPFFALFFILSILMIWLMVRHLEHRDQHARAKTHQLLLEICGSAPPKEPAE